jgi:hypothetical protein
MKGSHVAGVERERRRDRCKMIGERAPAQSARVLPWRPCIPRRRCVLAQDDPDTGARGRLRITAA